MGGSLPGLLLSSTLGAELRLPGTGPYLRSPHTPAFSAFHVSAFKVNLWTIKDMKWLNRVPRRCSLLFKGLITLNGALQNLNFPFWCFDSIERVY